MRTTWMATALVLALSTWGDWADARGGAPVGSASAEPSAVPPTDSSEGAMSVADLDKLTEPLRDVSLDNRMAAAKALGELGPEATLAIAQTLEALRKPGLDNGIYPVLKAARAASSKERGDDGDLLDGLLRLPPTGSTAHRTALVTACLLRALAHIGTTASVRQMVLVVHDQNGVFRPEVVRMLRQLGERATAGLIRASKDPSLPGLAHFASQQLEALGKKTPGDCVQTRSNEVLSEVLRAFGATHDLDATSVVLSFVNSDRGEVREAAREALGMYGQDAIWKLREAYVNLIGKSAPDDWNAARVAKELFGAYDRFRLQDVYTLIDEGLALAKDNKLDQATADFDKVLARQPLLDRRAEMVPAYVLYAQVIEDRDRAAALNDLRKAARLDPEGPRAQQIQSEVLYLEGKSLEDRGIADSDIFQRAILLDAGNTRARAELDRLESDADDRRERIRRWSAAGAVMATAIAAIILFAGRRKSAAPPPPRPRARVTS